MRRSYNPATSIYAGMSTAVLQQALDNAQAAHMALSSGSKGEAFSYTQGDGAKSVTYTRANIGALTALIKQLQAQLGIVSHGRRAIGFTYE